MTIATGSGLERFMRCRISSILPRVYDERPQHDRTLGIEVHAYLQRISQGMDPEESLFLVADAHREACRWIDLESIRDILDLAAEVALAYTPGTDTARVLGQAIDRKYDGAGVTADEVPLTMDNIGVNLKLRRGKVTDYKSGWAALPPVRDNWQMRGGAIALARTWDLDEVRCELIYLRDGQPVRRDYHVFDASELAAIAVQLAERKTLAAADRDAWQKRGELPDATRGSWCMYCPSVHVCPAMTGMIARVMDPAEFPSPNQISSLPDEMIADGYRRMKAARKALGMMEHAIESLAQVRPILLETLPNGDQIWFGMTKVVGNDKIKPEVARDVIADFFANNGLTPEAARAAAEDVCEVKITKKRLHAVVKTMAPPRKGKAWIDDVESELKKKGGIVNETKEEPAVYTVVATSRRLGEGGSDGE